MARKEKKNVKTLPGAERQHESALRNNPKQSRASEIVEKILYTTSELVTKHGVGKVTTTMIAEQINIPVGTVYRYFSNKEAILTVLAERDQVEKDQRFSEFQEEVSEYSGTDQYLRHLIKGILKYLRNKPGYIDLLKAATRLPDHYEQNLRSAERWSVAMSNLDRFADLKIPASRRMTFFKLAMLVAITAQERVLLCEDKEESARLEEEYILMLTSYFRTAAHPSHEDGAEPAT